MSDVLRIKRRAAGGAAGPPSSLAAAEIAFNEQDNILYYGKGNSSGQAVTIIPIAGDAKIGEAPVDGKTYGRKNATWVEFVGGSGGGASITISDTPPSSPTHGAMWWESDTNILWIYYDDGTSSQWVQVNGAAGGDFLPVTGGTLTGPLVVDLSQSITLNGGQFVSNDTQGNGAAFIGQRNSGYRWELRLGNGDAESGGTSGSTGNDLEITRYRNDGADIDKPLIIARATGQITTLLPVLPRTSWTAAQQLAQRKAVYAAPLDVIAHSGLQINGSFKVNTDVLLGTSVPIGNSSRYIGDLYFAVANYSGANVNALIGDWSAPYTHTLSFINAAAAGALTGTDTVHVRHLIEGFRIGRLKWGLSTAIPITVCFYLSTTKAGTAHVTVRNGDGTRTYTTPIAVTGGGAWNYYAVTIPGCTDGTWDRGVAIGLAALINFGAGSGATAPSANSWLSGNYQTGPGQTQFLTAANDNIYIHGFAVFPGSQGPPTVESLHECLRDPMTELALVQRQIQKSYASGVALGATGSTPSEILHSFNSSTTTSDGYTFELSPNMRVTPTMTFYNDNTGAAGTWRFFAAGGVQTVNVSAGVSNEKRVQVSATGMTGLTAGQGNYIFGHWLANARL